VNIHLSKKQSTYKRSSSSGGKGESKVQYYPIFVGNQSNPLPQPPPAPTTINHYYSQKEEERAKTGGNTIGAPPSSTPPIVPPLSIATPPRAPPPAVSNPPFPTPDRSKPFPEYYDDNATSSTTSTNKRRRPLTPDDYGLLGSFIRRPAQRAPQPQPTVDNPPPPLQREDIPTLERAMSGALSSIDENEELNSLDQSLAHIPTPVLPQEAIIPSQEELKEQKQYKTTVYERAKDAVYRAKVKLQNDPNYRPSSKSIKKYQLVENEDGTWTTLVNKD
jgi:hypothetical protein